MELTRNNVIENLLSIEEYERKLIKLQELKAQAYQNVSMSLHINPEIKRIEKVIISLQKLIKEMKKGASNKIFAYFLAYKKNLNAYHNIRDDHCIRKLKQDKTNREIMQIQEKLNINEELIKIKEEKLKVLRIFIVGG